MNDLEQKLKDYLQSPEGIAIQVLIAFTIGATPTIKDDEIVQNVDMVTDVIKSAIKKIAESEPTAKEAKQAGVLILEKVASMTKTKWDDRIVSVLSMFVGK